MQVDHFGDVIDSVTDDVAGAVGTRAEQGFLRKTFLTFPRPKMLIIM